MHLHESVFWGIIFFLMGIFFAPSIKIAGIALIVVTAVVILSGYAYRAKNKRVKYVAFLCGLMLVGALYWSGYNVWHKNKTDGLIGKRMMVAGHVMDVREFEKVQQVRMNLDAPRSGTIAVTARAYPRIEYGDAIRVEGIIKRPDKINAQYLMKDTVFASMDFPNITIKRQNDGNPIKQYLFGIRKNIVETYERTLSPDEAALLAGITIGERANFDKEFAEQMKQSGTTHLVALSGYNISIIAIAVMGMFSWDIKGGGKFLLAGGVIVLFVVMAGAEASAVRAAIMGSIVLLAQYIGRVHSMRNAIAVSALVMALWNPNVLRYDLGFQLSFAALIGIVYVKPYVDMVIKQGKTGVLDWRENLSGTTAAQLAVFPIIMHQIGTFSITALLSNILLLAFIPMTMFFGFLIGALGFISLWMASIPAVLVSVLLRYEIGVIRIFGAHAGLVMSMSAGMVILYYVIGGWMVFYLQKYMSCHSRGCGNPLFRTFLIKYGKNRERKK